MPDIWASKSLVPTAGEGLGESQFRRLEKKPSTLSTLWIGGFPEYMDVHILFLVYKQPIFKIWKEVCFTYRKAQYCGVRYEYSMQIKRKASMLKRVKS
jgi:hypothetical protein